MLTLLVVILILCTFLPLFFPGKYLIFFIVSSFALGLELSYLEKSEKCWGNSIIKQPILWMFWDNISADKKCTEFSFLLGSVLSLQCHRGSLFNTLIICFILKQINFCYTPLQAIVDLINMLTNLSDVCSNLETKSWNILAGACLILDNFSNYSL